MTRVLRGRDLRVLHGAHLAVVSALTPSVVQALDLRSGELPQILGRWRRSPCSLAPSCAAVS